MPPVLCLRVQGHVRDLTDVHLVILEDDCAVLKVPDLVSDFGGITFNFKGNDVASFISDFLVSAFGEQERILTKRRKREQQKTSQSKFNGEY